VGNTRERVVLVHELRELRSSEELLDRRNNRTDVDKRLRRDGFHVLRRHALTHDTLHAGETDTNLVLDQFANGADATVGEMVLVVEAVTRLAVREVQHVARSSEHLGLAEHALAFFGLLELDAKDLLELLHLGTKFAVELVATDASEVVTLGVEESVLEVHASGFDIGWLTRTSTLVDLDQSFFTGRR
jgi:hypothetical protein